MNISTGNNLKFADADTKPFDSKQVSPGIPDDTETGDREKSDDANKATMRDRDIRCMLVLYPIVYRHIMQGQMLLIVWGGARHVK